MIYCYPRLSEIDLIGFRVGGPGLGNLLFPWARALVHARTNGLGFIPPTWPQLKLGPILRCERDFRGYAGLFGRSPASVGGIRRAWLLASRRRVLEGLSPDAKDGDIIEFRGLEGQFEDLLSHHRMIFERLVAMTLPRHHAGLESDFRGSISVHVRLGDFRQALPANSEACTVNRRIDLAWYVKTVCELRARLGNAKVYVFSDGPDEELAPLLTLRDCHRVGFGSAIADLLALSAANVLIGSNSTFSGWASFLGQMPTVWCDGHTPRGLPPADVQSVIADSKRSVISSW